MKLLNFTIIKLACFLVLGILLACYTSIPLTVSLYASLFLVFVLSLTYWVSIHKKTKSIWFALISYISITFIGVLVTNLNNEKLAENHYLRFDSSQATTFRIRSILKSGNYNDKYVIDVLKIDAVQVSGKALLNIKKDSINEKLKVDAIYITTDYFHKIKDVTNPNQFNYKKYLERQYIYKQIYTTQPTLFKVSDKKHTVYGYADSIRENINNKLKTYAFSLDELAIINALLLGQRQNLSNAVKADYINSGAIHVLAVSGLHVGILLFLLNFIFKPLDNNKRTRIIKSILIISLLWSFAIIAGLSASVTRAVTMFSIVQIAMTLNRPTNIYNTLAISIFVLLLFKPLFIFDVGFQLSYLAVFAIVSIQPLLVKYWQPKYYIPKKLWDIFTVTIAAQLGVLPISLFYFHQIPSLFFIANLIIIPFLGLILGLGILVITLALLNSLPSFLVEFYSGIITAMNSLMQWISHQETFLFKDISFNLLQVLSAYLLIISVIKLLTNKNYNWFRLTLVSVLIFQSVSIFNKYNNSFNSFTIFHKSKYTVLGKKSNNRLKVYSNLDSIGQFNSLKDYAVGNRITKIKPHRLQPLFKLKNEYLFIIDSLGTYNVKGFKPDYVLIRNSPKINLKRVIDSLKPNHIIADGSNYPSYITRWETTCKKQKTPFHYTGEKGAFIIE